MKVATVLGTRPEIIRLSRTIPLLDNHCDHFLVHTGQNYTDNLSDVFFRDLGIRAPDEYLGVKAGNFAEQVGQIISRSAALFERERPDRVLVLGDTNSGMAAFSAARMGIPVYHIEGGNRCYDDRVPEEVNRRAIDSFSTVLMAYSDRSKDNLLGEGVDRERIFVIGNPIFEVLNHYSSQIDRSEVLDKLALSDGRYFAATLHRTENVDERERLEELLGSLHAAGQEHGVPVVLSLHPRTMDRMKAMGIEEKKYQIQYTPALGLFDWVELEKHALAVLTDSGTLQDECSIFRVPLVTLRDVTERAETLESGSNVLAGADQDTILRGLRLALASARQWTIPREYLEPQVSVTIAKILLGHLPFRKLRFRA